MEGWPGCCCAGGVVCCWSEDVEEVPAPAAPCALTGAENIATHKHRGNTVRGRPNFISKNLLEICIAIPGNQCEIAYTDFSIFSPRKDPFPAGESATQRPNPQTMHKPPYIPKPAVVRVDLCCSAVPFET